MLKIAIVLCVALCAAAEFSNFGTMFNDTSDLIAGRVVNDVILKVESDMRQAHERAEAELEKIIRNTFNKADDFSKKIVDVIAKSHGKFLRILKDYNAGLSVECLRTGRPLWAIAGLQSRVMSKANKCLAEEMKKGFSHRGGFGLEYHQGLSNITSIKAEVEETCREMQEGYLHLFEIPRNLSSRVDLLIDAKYCRETVAAKAYEVSVAVISTSNVRVKFLADWWETASPKLDACTNASLLRELDDEAMAIAQAFEECLRANIKLSQENKEIDDKPVKKEVV